MEKKTEGDLYMLTEDQVKKLKNLTERYDDIVKVLDNRVDLWNIEDFKTDRKQKTIMINTEIDSIIDKHIKKSRLSYSDVVNIALKKGLEFIK